MQLPYSMRFLGLGAWLLALIAGSTWAQPKPATLAQCMACHGPQGNSQVPAIPSLAGQPKQFIENQLVLIREGLRVVAAMRDQLDGMQDAELVQLANYFSAQKPSLVNQGMINTVRFQRGQAMARQALCGTCHLPDYSGREQIPRLAGQHEAFLLESMKQFRDHAGLGRDTLMSAALHGFKDVELADMAHFLANIR